MSIEKAAALLARAYRLALVMEGRRLPADIEACEVTSREFEDFAVAKELVAILDEARISLLAKAGATTGSGKWHQRRLSADRERLHPVGSESAHFEVSRPAERLLLLGPVGFNVAAAPQLQEGVRIRTRAGHGPPERTRGWRLASPTP